MIIQTRSTAKCYAAIGQRRDRAAFSNLALQGDQNGASADGTIPMLDARSNSAPAQVYQALDIAVVDPSLPKVGAEYGKPHVRFFPCTAGAVAPLQPDREAIGAQGVPRAGPLLSTGC